MRRHVCYAASTQKVVSVKGYRRPCMSVNVRLYKGEQCRRRTRKSLPDDVRLAQSKGL